MWYVSYKRLLGVSAALLAILAYLFVPKYMNRNVEYHLLLEEFSMEDYAASIEQFAPSEDIYFGPLNPEQAKARIVAMRGWLEEVEIDIPDQTVRRWFSVYYDPENDAYLVKDFQNLNMTLGFLNRERSNSYMAIINRQDGHLLAMWYSFDRRSLGGLPIEKLSCVEE